VEADVYVWCYALLVIHARKEEEDNCFKAFAANVLTVLYRYYFLK